MTLVGPVVMLRRAEMPVTGALVRHGHCAQPGDNVVDHSLESVRIADRTCDSLWFPLATIPSIPSSLPASTGYSTTYRLGNKPPDLREHRFSTVSTVLMTTSSEIRN